MWGIVQKKPPPTCSFQNFLKCVFSTTPKTRFKHSLRIWGLSQHLWANLAHYGSHAALHIVILLCVHVHVHKAYDSCQVLTFND